MKNTGDLIACGIFLTFILWFTHYIITDIVEVKETIEVIENER